MASKYLTKAQRIQDNIRKELGEAYEFVEIGDIATLDQLMKDLAVEERLDSMIENTLKRLLFLKGLNRFSVDSDRTAGSKGKSFCAAFRWQIPSRHGERSAAQPKPNVRKFGHYPKRSKPSSVSGFRRSGPSWVPSN